MILDATCGLREMWFTKSDPETIYLDRVKQTLRQSGLGWRPVRVDIRVTVLGDNRFLPFRDGVFDLVVYDLPQLIERTRLVKLRKGSYFQHMYGTQEPDFWEVDMSRASRELFRVLKPGGFLVFKWAEHDRSLRAVLPLFHYPPLFGSWTQAETWFIVFRKDPP